MTTEHRGLASWTADRRITTKIAMAFGLALALMLGIVAVALVNKAALTRTNAQVTHTYEVLGGLDDISAHIAAAETGQRGYLLTGEESYLAPYTEASTDMDGVIGVVADLTADNPDQQERIATLRELVTAKFTEMQSTIDLRGTDGFDAALAVVLQDTGKEVMDQITATTAAMADEETTLLASRQAAATEAASRASAVMLAAAALGAVLFVVLSLVLARGITRPLARVVEVLDAMSEGRLDRRVGLDRRDEVGRMAAALDSTAASLAGVMSSVVASSDAVASASEQLSASSSEISAAAEETSAQSGVVSSAADEVSRSVATVAAGAEQMGASIREIAQNANQAARVASQAVGVAATANETVTKLGTSSKEIGDVVKTITSIAEQTNLLALNATIEAARAGEAGKGFAVVANEVKELAQETARATDDISRRVATIQADTTGAVAAIDEISAIIASINDFQTTIASAVEEQTATTQEMSRSVAEAAGGSTEIASNITGVSAAAQSTTEALSQTRVAVGELASLAAELRGRVARFTT